MSETAGKTENSGGNSSGASFEERLEAVQRMIGQIESGSLPLEESVKRYEEGMNLLKALDAELKDYGRRLTVLRPGADGVDREENMEEPE